MRMIIAKVADMVQLADEQLAALDNYTDAAIQHALNRLKKSKNVANPAALFMYILRKDVGLEQQQPSIKQQLASSQTKDKDTHKREAIGSLNDRYTAAEIEHCEKLLQKFDKISVEHPDEAQKIVNRQPSSRWSASWPTPELLEKRLSKLKK